MDTFLQDLRYAARKLLRTPGFTVVAITTLALAIGATTAVFSIVDGVLLRPLPFRQPDRIVRIESTNREGKTFPISPADYLDYRDQSTSFEAMAQYGMGTANLATEGGEPAHLDRGTVGARFFEILGVQPLVGRLFAANEDAPGQPLVAVISEKLWRNRFGGDAGVIGKPITLDERAYTVIGVAPRTVTYPQPADVWIPRGIQPSSDPGARGGHSFFAIARLKPGVTTERAKAELLAIAKRLQVQYPETNTGFGATATSIQEQLVGDLRPTLYAMLGAVGFVLLIACANVANLLLVRASSRAGEMAVRTALGAGTSRIVRQLMTESLLLAAGGAVLGMALAAWVVNAIIAFGPNTLPRMQELAVDARVLGFSAFIATITGVAFGLVPAVHAARPDIASMLRESVRGTSRGGAHRTRRLLVISEMALAVVLLTGAGLLIRSFTALLRVDLGFRTENVVTFDVALPGAKYRGDAERVAAVDRISRGLQAMPGSQAVGVTVGRPLSRMMMMTSFDVVGRPVSDPAHRTITEVHAASPGFFGAMGMSLKSGRVFTDAENRMDGHHALMINQELAKRFFPNENPIGKELVLGMSYGAPPSSPTSADTAIHGEVVGIISDVKQRGLATDAFPSVYVPYNTLPGGSNSFVIRSAAAAPSVENAVREQVRAVDPNLPVFGLQTMSEVVSDSVAQPRFYMVLLTAFAGIALLLAALGIYGVISYTVSQRSREIGIRIALGATRDRVVRDVLTQGLSMTTIGVAVGLASAFALTRLIANLLFGVAAVDAVTFAGVAALLLGVAAAASWVPARRAGSVDPLIAMRAD